MDSQSDILNFEHIQREIIYELNMKRALLRECRQNLLDSNIKQQELEDAIDKEKRENNENKVQLDIALKALNRVDEEQKLKETSSLQKIQLEIYEKDQKSLLTQLHSTQLENSSLKRRLKELEEQQQYISTSQKDALENFSAVNFAVNELKSTLEKLEGDQRRVQRDVESATNIGKQMECTITKLSKENETLNHECKRLEKDVLVKSAELEKYKQKEQIDLMDESQMYINDFLSKEVKETINYLRNQLATHSQTVFELTSSLNTANKDLLTLRQNENNRKENIIKETCAVTTQTIDNSLSIILEDISCQTEDNI